MALVFSAIIALFFFLLLIKAMIKKEFCVICASISLTWIGLLFLGFNNLIFVSLLIGQSIIGIYYILEKKFSLFRLPIILSLTFLAYGALTYDYSAWLIIILLWVLFIAIFLFKTNKKINKLINKLIACCKNW